MSLSSTSVPDSELMSCSWFTVSKAFEYSMKHAYSSFPISRYFSLMTFKQKIASLAPLFFLNPACSQSTSMSILLVILFRITVSRSLSVWHIKLMVLWSEHSSAFCFLGRRMNTDVFKSSGIYTGVYISL